MEEDALILLRTESNGHLVGEVVHRLGRLVAAEAIGTIWRGHVDKRKVCSRMLNSNVKTRKMNKLGISSKMYCLTCIHKTTKEQAFIQHSYLPKRPDLFPQKHNVTT